MHGRKLDGEIVWKNRWLFSLPAIPPEVLITADLCDTINEKLIQIQKKTVFSDVVINLAISTALNVNWTTH